MSHSFQGIEVLRDKLKSDLAPNDIEITAAHTEILAVKNNEEARGHLLSLRDAIDARKNTGLAGDLILKLDALKSEIPERTPLEVAGQMGTQTLEAAKDAGEKSLVIGSSMLQEGMAAGHDIVERAKKGDIRGAVTEHPYVAAALLYTGFTWLSGKMLSVFDEEERPGFFTRLARTALTITGIAFLSRLVQNFSTENKSEETVQPTVPEPKPYDDAVTPAPPATQIPPENSPTQKPQTPTAKDSDPVAQSPATPANKDNTPVTAPAKKPTDAPPASQNKEVPIKPQELVLGPQEKSVSVDGKNYTVSFRQDTLTVNGRKWQLKGTGSAAAAAFSIERLIVNPDLSLRVSVNVKPPYVPIFSDGKPFSVFDTIGADTARSMLRHFSSGSRSPYALPPTKDPKSNKQYVLNFTAA